MLEVFLSNIVQEEVNRHQKKLSPDAYQQAKTIGDAIIENILANIQSRKSDNERELYFQTINQVFGLNT
jgi:3-dehydroquinate dehydratase